MAASLSQTAYLQSIWPGLFLTFWQVRLVKKLATTQFEDTLGREYRELAGRLPTKALLGEELTNEEYAAALDEFIHYIDLCNEQVFLRRCERITLTTWEYWRDGIRTNLEQPAFARAWAEIKNRSTNFRELRRLELEGFQSDPAKWETCVEQDVPPKPAKNSEPNV
jgi:hypothetical protein